MAIQDLTPFGTLPRAYQGLLGAEETSELQKRAQIQGLLGAGLALAQGMSAYGPPRSALQNIIGAVAGGFQGAGGAYEGGLKQAMTAQDIRQKQIQIQQSDALRRDVEAVMRTPEVANNPSLVALLRADPKEGLKWINENMAVTQAYAKTMPQQQPANLSPEAQANTVTAPMDERARLFTENRILTGIGTEAARKKIESNLKQIEAYDKQEEIIRKQQDFTNEARRVAGYLFPNHDFTQPLNAQQSKQLNDELQKLNVEQKRAGAASVNVNMPTESERGAGFLAARLQNSLAQYQNVVGGKNVVGSNPKAALPNLTAEIVKGVTRSDYLKNLVNPEDRQRVEAAQFDMISAALTLSTGAAYTKEEIENQRMALFPQLGDKPETIRDKAVRLNNLLGQARIKAGRAAPSELPSQNAPFNFDMNAINQELENRKKGK
jgi:hypothetical protein